MRRALLLVAIGGALVSAVAAALDCPACGGPPGLALAGLAAYASLLVIVVALRDERPARFGLMAASGFHLGLIGAMADRGSACPLCLAAALSIFAATGLALAGDRRSWPLLPVVSPWTAALGLLVAPPANPADLPAHTRVVAYTRVDCPYCDELRDRVLPEATRGLDVEVVFRDAESADFVRRAPTLLISRGRRFRVVEGLPTVTRLRDEIAKVGDAP